MSKCLGKFRANYILGQADNDEIDLGLPQLDLRAIWITHKPR